MGDSDSRPWLHRWRIGPSLLKILCWSKFGLIFGHFWPEFGSHFLSGCSSMAGCSASCYLGRRTRRSWSSSCCSSSASSSSPSSVASTSSTLRAEGWGLKRNGPKYNNCLVTGGDPTILRYSSATIISPKADRREYLKHPDLSSSWQKQPSHLL